MSKKLKVNGCQECKYFDIIYHLLTNKPASCTLLNRDLAEEKPYVMKYPIPSNCPLEDWDGPQ